MDPNQSTAKGFFASLAALVVVLLGFFVLMFTGQSDRVVTLAGLEDKHGKSSEKIRRQGESQSLSQAVSGENPTSAARPPAGDTQGYRFDTQESDYQRTSPITRVATPSDGPLPTPVDDPQVQKAIALVDQGKVTEAMKVLDDVLAKDPKNEQALVEMAMIHLLDLKQPDSAMGYMQKVVEINPTNQIVLNELVSLYSEQGRVDDGLNYLMDLAEKKPGSSDLSYSIGQMMSLSGREQDAIPYMEKAAQSPLHQTRAFRDLGETYSHLGDFDKSIEFYDKAIASQEREISERNSAGTPVTYAAERLVYIKSDKIRVLMQKGDFEAAQSILSEVKAQMPNDPNIAQLEDSLRRKKSAG